MQLEHEILLHPKYFGPNLIETVKAKLFSDIEGTCSGKYGFIVAVTNIDHIGAGMLLPGRGFVQYHIVYRAIVFRPFKGEVIDAVVTQINKVGVFAEAGPLSIFISKYSIPQNIKFEGAEPTNENANEDDEEEETHIVQMEDRIRLRIIGLRVDASAIFAVGTLMDDYLGTL
ncbi:DNA directed rna polymerase II 19 kDa polypeptide [Echinococcus multilocularis]|uniref:DNA-directed RNA polymerase II subunit RPB7 n=2 Tax=Echinococcus TaxID=6209 RepID=A0A068WER7_ECHGR|nr:DNA directed rna polymerase II 19 kDa polypeptide [Echinococcus granulosus]CDS40950.1 DNA directed rna polymerase II 19 kDa polypeptide [Echinococcus multilocularis]